MYVEPLEPKRNCIKLSQMMSWLYAQNPVLIPGQNLHALSTQNLFQKSRKTIWKTLYSTKHSLKDLGKFLESLFQRFLK